MKPTVNNKLKSQAEKIAWITFFWVLVSLSQFMIGYVALIQLNCAMDEIDAWVYLQGSLITGVAAGLIGGSSIVLYWENWLRTKPYGKALLSMAWSYTLIFLAVALISGLFFISSQLGAPISDPEVWEQLWDQFFSLEQFLIYLFWLSIVIFTLIGLSVNDKYGPGVFKSFVLGKYFHPKREERIFMFLDLRGSTSIAEKLGEEKYFNFLKDIFKDVHTGHSKFTGADLSICRR